MSRLILGLFLIGCRDADKADVDTGSVAAALDEDRDGYTTAADCNDGDPAVSPSAQEICDGLDNDCDGEVDEGVGVTFYSDGDGDGYGDAATTIEACSQPAGHVANATDCDDADPTTYPAATEICDGLDNDCDGETDEDVSEAWYADADGDGFGDADALAYACDAPTGHVADATDCDDESAETFPEAAEVCDERDNDCDGETDEGARETFYEDSDGDGYGVSTNTAEACEAPSGYVGSHGDCDDSDARVHPAAEESDCADPRDYNCDGSVGYADADADGWAACEECDDADSGVHPDAAEICSEVDEDCDGLIDEDDPDLIDATTWNIDYDGDGYGSDSYTTEACEQPSGFTADSDDCDDTDAAINPDALEVCDDADNDCDGDTDDEDATLDTSTASTWYADADEDGFGDVDSSALACEQPSGFTTDSDDCDDTDAAINPDALEVCDEADNDCDGDTDDEDTDVTDPSTWYTDADVDGYGDSATEACVAPSGTSDLSGDCDDSDPAFNPAAAEGCDGLDYNCDGAIDNDLDEDGYADAACGGTDCDDSDASIVPEAGGGCALGADCRDILDSGSSTGDGTYTIDPDGWGTGLDPFDVTCDMTTDGGGWTPVLHLYDMSSLDEDDFISLYGHNRFTDETWSYDGTIADGLSSDGLVSLTGQGAVDISAFDGLWDDLRMTCSGSSDDASEEAYAQVDGYATTNAEWSLLGAASNGTSYSVDSSLNSVGQSTIWHDNEIDTHNSGHYLCDITDSAYSSDGGAPQLGFCYTDHLNNSNSSDYGDSIVAIAFGTIEGADSWSEGFTIECGDMGTSALQNSGTVSVWVR